MSELIIEMLCLVICPYFRNFCIYNSSNDEVSFKE